MIKPSLETMSAVEVQQNLATLLNELADENKRVVIELNGTPIAILAPYEDFARLKRSDEVRAERHDFLEEFRSHFRDVDQDELQREIDRAVEEVRAEMREERRTRQLAS